MVRRLVEEEHVRLAVEHLRDEDAELVAACEGVHPRLVLVGRDTETDKELSRFALGHVAVLFGDRPLELAEADTNLVRHLAGEEALLLLHRLPQGFVPHDDGVEDALLLVLEVVLTEDAKAEVARDRDRPGVRDLVELEHLEERRLPGAVRAGEAVALPRIELHRDVLEEDLGAETLGNFVEDNHSAPLLARSRGRAEPSRLRSHARRRLLPGDHASWDPRLSSSGEKHHCGWLGHHCGWLGR